MARLWVTVVGSGGPTTTEMEVESYKVVEGGALQVTLEGGMRQRFFSPSAWQSIEDEVPEPFVA